MERVDSQTDTAYAIGRFMSRHGAMVLGFAFVGFAALPLYAAWISDPAAFSVLLIGAGSIGGALLYLGEMLTSGARHRQPAQPARTTLPAIRQLALPAPYHRVDTSH